MIKEKRTPIKYWGGKTALLPRILPLIPEHHTYCEPFFGGGAVFFAKPKSKVEAINDINDNVVNFYRTLKGNFDALKAEIDLTLYAESEHAKAKKIYANAEDKDAVLRAWAVYVLSRQSYMGCLDGTWAFNRSRDFAGSFARSKEWFDETYVHRLDGVQVFCRDAVRVIGNMDSQKTFFFCDPPYYNADMGHYAGYSIDDYRRLLDALSEVEGKFLLTTYPSDILTEYTERFRWNTIKHVLHKASSKKEGETKIEVFTTNYIS